MGIWASLKAASWGVKLALLGGVLAFLLAVGGGLYYVGYTKGANVSKVEISKYEKKVSDLNTKLKTATGKVDIREVTVYKDKLIYQDRVVTKNHEVIKYQVPEQFKVSQGWIYAYNQSIAGLPIDPEKAKDDRASWASDRSVLGFVADNNGVCLANGTQLDSVIATIKAREAALNEVNK